MVWGAKVMSRLLLRSKSSVRVVVFWRGSVSASPRVALGDLPLAGIDLPAGHAGGDGGGVEVVGDDLDVVGRADGDEDGDALLVGGGLEPPADDVAGVVVAAHEGDAAEARALELAVVEVDAVDPEAALGVDELAVGRGLDLRGVDLVEVFGVAGELPGELVVGLAGGGGVVALLGGGGFENVFAPGVADVEHVEGVGVDGAEGCGGVVAEGQDVFLVAGPAIGGPQDEPGDHCAPGRSSLVLKLTV